MRFRAADVMTWLEQLRQLVAGLLAVDHLVPFSAGLLGYIGYDAVHYLEELPKTTCDDRQLPDIRLQWHAVITQITDGDVHVFDSIDALARVAPQTVITDLRAEAARTREIVANPAAALEFGAERLDALAQMSESASVSLPPTAGQVGGQVQEDVSQALFEANVERAKEYIRAGDIFQVVLSKRLRVAKQLHPYVAYDRLRKLNPSPYMFVAEYPDMRVFGASPEVQFRAVGRKAQMKPIAGTSKGRGKTPAEDKVLADRLLADEKERAEHVMLVDLCRNDLGRVCEIGSIRVPELMVVEPYSHLFHLVSVVEGTLREDTSVFHALLATFPAGTLSGAPKIRAMEIIDELESLRRGPYGGMLGMIDFAGNANTAIVIRTVVEADDAYYVQVGAGIVADSVPSQEWLECGHKAGATIDVLTSRLVRV
ncbi:anthranilate synthase component I family protein [Alicyclobacillus sp. ALC3]|nr:anthranilate synthase component I family protein [Alicyclobacillus sp. ALC3]